MTPAQLKKRVAVWQQRMNLQHWRLTVDITDEPRGKPSAAAGVTYSAFYDKADLEFQTELIAHESVHEIDCTIVHELVHIQLRDLDQTLWSITAHLAAPAEDVYEKAIERATEGFVDRIARVIVAGYSK